MTRSAPSLSRRFLSALAIFSCFVSVIAASIRIPAISLNSVEVCLLALDFFYCGTSGL